MSASRDGFIKEKLRTLPHAPGVYLMKDRLGSVLYVGKAKDLKKRVSSYFLASRRAAIERPKIAAMMPLVYDIEISVVRNETEALLLEGRLIKHWRPKYNTEFTDDKRFPLVRLDLRRPIPQFIVCRLRREDGARYFGPFAHSATVRKTLAQMRKRFGVLLGDARPQPLGNGRWRLYDDARAEIYGHPNEVSQEQYMESVNRAIEFLEDRARQWRGELQERMKEAAREQRYEEAAHLRDLLQDLEKAFVPARKFTEYFPVQRNPEGAQMLLARALGLPQKLHSMECFDISHISGSFAVASMVRFEGGMPARHAYRHFHIKSFVGNDDFRAMREVIGRRYRRLHQEGIPFPDLLVVDGGKGQISSALKAFADEGLSPPPLIGLAKEEEAIIFADPKKQPLILPRSNPALRLLQRLRDEAHRFANTFNASLRSRKIRESILDECPHLGPKHRAALLAYFGSIQRLRRASVEEIEKVPGFGEKRANSVYDFLKSLSSPISIQGELRLPEPPKGRTISK